MDKAIRFNRHIGSTTYKVKVILAEDGNGTMEEKILRILQNEMLEPAGGCGILDLPQTSRQSERSA